MRISTPSWLLCAVLPAIATASSQGRVYLYDDAETASQLRTAEFVTVDPATVRLILAQRLDLSHFHTVADANDEAIRHVNAYGGQSQHLFGLDSHEESKSRVMIVVDHVEDPLVPALTEFTHFAVSPAPHPKDSSDLFTTFASEAAQVPYTDGPDASVLRLLQPLSDVAINSIRSYNNRRTLLHVKSIATARTADRSDQLQILKSVLTNLYNLAKENNGQLSLSIMFMPPEHLCSKRSINAYGISTSSLKARAANAERGDVEKLLSEPAPAAAAKSSSTSMAPTKSTQLSGPIPTCFASQSSCERATNNCTGHGACIRKWGGPGDGGKNNDCYGCMCSIPEVRKNGDGSTKTTHFGGAACHKKDIVTSFWLLAGTTVFLLFIVGWGLGLLYTMGSEELPSVLGAGVSTSGRK